MDEIEVIQTTYEHLRVFNADPQADRIWPRAPPACDLVRVTKWFCG